MDRIKLLRTENNMTQSQLAVIVDKGEGAIRAWETGRAKPDADTLIKLSDYFKCTIDYLMGMNEYRNTDDVETVVSRFDRLALNVEKLQERQYERFLYQLNECIDFIFNNPFGQDELFDEYNVVSDGFRLIMNMFLNMCRSAATLYNSLKEQGIQILDQSYHVNFDIAEITEVLNSKNGIIGVSAYCYDRLFWLLHDVLKSEEEKSAISNILLDTWKYPHTIDQTKP